MKSPIVLGRAHQQVSHEAPASGLVSAVAAGALRPIVDQDGVLNYVETYTKDGRTCRQVVRSGSGAANDLILTTVAAGGGKAPSQQTIAMHEAQLRTKAKRAGEVTTVALRVAQDGDTRYVDLGPGRIVRIDPQGWAQVDESEGYPCFDEVLELANCLTQSPLKATLVQPWRTALATSKSCSRPRWIKPLSALRSCSTASTPTLPTRSASTLAQQVRAKALQPSTTWG